MRVSWNSLSQQFVVAWDVQIMTKPSSEFFESSSIQSSKERIETSQFSMMIFDHEIANWGGANMHAKCLCEAVILSSSVQSLQKASLAAETTCGEILAAFWPKHDVRSNLMQSA